MNFKNLTILLTGGTGSFGQTFTRMIVEKYHPKILRIFSRDELKQSEMQQRYEKNSFLRFFIGDVRDKERLKRAMEGVDLVVHAAALKQVPSCEYNPFETVKTNILGTQNVIETCLDEKVKKAILISSDKAVSPINLYGATKLCAEKLFIQGNSYAGRSKTRFSVARFGNVLGSRGSIVPLISEQKKTGTVTLTDKEMTRFWITRYEAVDFVLKILEIMVGGEVFVPKLPSVKITDLIEVLAPSVRLKIIGRRPGEKLHEMLITPEEAVHTREFVDSFLIEPEFRFWGGNFLKGGKKLSKNFSYQSNTNTWWLTAKELQKAFKNNPWGR